MATSPAAGASRPPPEKGRTLTLAKRLALVAGLFVFASSAQARMLEAGPGRTYAALSDALSVAAPGDTIRIFPGHYASCAVLLTDGLTLEGVGEADTVVLDGGICQGKAILVAAARDLVIRNLTLAGARVPDGNGAGIRAEGGMLSVESVRFVDDQNGILTSDTAHDMVLLVRHSLFERDGACLRACAHGIYAGHIAQLHVLDSVFRGTREGHAIKSRAASTEVTGCDIMDGPDGTGSYLIEAPNGGNVLIRDNRLEKGPRAGNSAAIAIGTEGVDQPTSTLVVTENHFTNDSGRRMVFIRNDSPIPADLHGNVLIGPTTPFTGPGKLH